MRTTTKPRATSETAALAARLRLSATRLARRLRQQSDAGLSPSQLSALATVDHHGPMTLGALAEHERVAPPSVTKVVAKLEASGLVARRTDEADKRVVWVSTTLAGDELLATVRKRKDAWLTARIAELDAGDRQRLANALDVLEALAEDAG